MALVGREKERRISCMVCDATYIHRLLSFHRDEGESELNERKAREKGERRIERETEKEKRKVPRMSARRKRRDWSQERRKEGGRSGSPALLALRWLKAKESARPRTRPGRDLLPSSFLHPALSHRAAPLSCLAWCVPTLRRISFLRALPFYTQTIASQTRCYF